MMAQDLATVTELNRLARAGRVATGQVGPDGLALSDGLVGGVGDVIVTRQNDRALRLSDGEWVRNRDRFVVVSTHDDGAMTVRHLDGDGYVVLPPAYVADHVELGYASSAHAAQGQTVGTAHALVSTAMTREVLYVATTRARESNRLYVDSSRNRRERRWPTGLAKSSTPGTSWSLSPLAKEPSARPTRAR
jgi:ATP-dependent exoDNAse (exonuclease V) alpha subunit